MSKYLITATSTSDDYKRVYSNAETKTASSYEDAVACAVSFYLERVNDYDMFEYEDATEFNSIVDEHKGDFGELMQTLHEYFEASEDTLFKGEFVPNTYCVSIEQEGDDNEIDKDAILELVSEIRGEEDDEEEDED